MKNTPVLLSIGAFFTGSIGLVQSIHAENNQRPNIVLIIADDISKRDVGCYGNTFVKTPNIDALAKDGLRFTNVFLTASSSSPSRASIITGRYPHNTGACELHSPIGDEQIFFPNLLQNAGYYTAQAGKWHISRPAKTCFDRSGGALEDGGGESGCKKWVTFLHERPKDKPFFMWFASHDAHREFWDKELDETYDEKTVVSSPFLINDKNTRKDLAGYYNEITRFDSYVGDVIQELKNQNVLGNTIVIVMADNGRDFPRAKTLLLEDGIMTPFIVHLPPGMSKKNIQCNSLLSSIDIAPTLLELAGVDSMPKSFQGRSFCGLFKNPNKKFRNYVFAEHNWHVYEAYERMVCTDQYLLIENKRPNLPGRGTVGSPSDKSLVKAYEKGTLTHLQQELFQLPRKDVVLFDRKKDSDQIHDLSETKKALSAKMLSVLHTWQTETDDTLPLYLKPDRNKEVTLTLELKEKIEMPGASKNAILNRKSGPF